MTDTICLAVELHAENQRQRTATVWFLPEHWDSQFPSIGRLCDQSEARKVLESVEARAAIVCQQKLARVFRDFGFKVQEEVM